MALILTVMAVLAALTAMPYGTIANFLSGIALILPILLLWEYVDDWIADRSETVAVDGFYADVSSTPSVFYYPIIFVLSDFLFYWSAATLEGCNLKWLAILATFILATFILATFMAKLMASEFEKSNEILIIPMLLLLGFMWLNALCREPQDFDCNGPLKYILVIVIGTIMTGVFSFVLLIAYFMCGANPSNRYS